MTPSSHPGTPPQHQPNDLLTGTNFSTSLANSLSSGQIKPEFATARTYSDQLRNFAAKYNALNEYVANYHLINRSKTNFFLFLFCGIILDRTVFVTLCSTLDSILVQ